MYKSIQGAGVAASVLTSRGQLISPSCQSRTSSVTIEAISDHRGSRPKWNVFLKGRPYDTMEEVIGMRGTAGHGSLQEWGVGYEEVPLAAHGGIEWPAFEQSLRPGESW